MNALVIYDSVFGNTEIIARTIATGLDALALTVIQASADEVSRLDLLVVGSPTRGFRPTEAISKFLNELAGNHLAGILVASFDTRIALETINSSVFRFIVDKGGYAASTIAKLLEKKGGKLLVPPEGFIVMGEQGPLKDGEMGRAAEWAKRLISMQ